MPWHTSELCLYFSGVLYYCKIIVFIWLTDHIAYPNSTVWMVHSCVVSLQSWTKYTAPVLSIAVCCLHLQVHCLLAVLASKKGPWHKTPTLPGVCENIFFGTANDDGAEFLCDPRLTCLLKPLRNGGRWNGRIELNNEQGLQGGVELSICRRAENERKGAN